MTTTSFPRSRVGMCLTLSGKPAAITLEPEWYDYDLVPMLPRGNVPDAAAITLEPEWYDYDLVPMLPRGNVPDAAATTQERGSQMDGFRAQAAPPVFIGWLARFGRSC